MPVINERAESIIRQINYLKENNEELNDTNIDRTKENDELRKKINLMNYNLAIKENNIHYLNNKLNLISIEKKKKLDAVSIENIKVNDNHMNINNLLNEANMKLNEANRELEYIKATNTYKIWKRYNRLPGWMRSFNRGMLVPLKAIFKLIKR